MKKKRKLGNLQKKEKTMNDMLSKEMTREELKPVLRSVADKRFEQMFDMMHDPAHSNKSLSTIARECGVQHMELCDAIRKYKMGIGIVRMSKHVPDIMEDVAVDAKSREDVCPHCEGVGTVLRDQTVQMEGESLKATKVPVECPKCHGKTTIRKPGDTNSRKLIYESIGLTGKTPLIAVQNNTLTATFDGPEELLKLSRKPQAQLPEVKVESAEIIEDGK